MLYAASISWPDRIIQKAIVKHELAWTPVHPAFHPPDWIALAAQQSGEPFDLVQAGSAWQPRVKCVV
jgi:hypothetical protein